MPNIIFGIVSILAGIISLLLPETKDEEMYDDIAQLEKNAIITNTLQDHSSDSNENDNIPTNKDRVIFTSILPMPNGNA